MSLNGQSPFAGDEGMTPSPAFVDPLTGLLDRAGLIDWASGGAPASSAVIYIDIDNFRRVNAAHGHIAGDAVLVELARRLREEAGGDALVAHMSGDEFILLIPNADSERALSCARALFDRLHQPVQVERQSIRLTASIGVASVCARGNLEEALRHADVAMTYAKLQGDHPRIHAYSAELRSHAAAQMAIETDLRLALLSGQFELFYQPLVDLSTRATIEVEALLRWRHPERGLLEPASFLLEAEQLGLMCEIGAWVLREACRQGRIWQELRRSGSPIVMAVNLSPAQVRDERLPDALKLILQESGFPPSLLRLEISESIAREDIAPAITAMQRLRELGVLMSLDDFGAGYAGWSFLRHCPIDGIKIDRSLLEARDSDGAGRTDLVEAVLALAAQLGMAVGVEGIERAGQADAMRDLGIRTAQGYFFGHPEPARSISAKLMA